MCQVHTTNYVGIDIQEKKKRIKLKIPTKERVILRIK